MRHFQFILFCITSFSYFGQSRIDFIKSNGYTVVSDLNPFTESRNDAPKVVTELILKRFRMFSDLIPSALEKFRE